MRKIGIVLFILCVIYFIGGFCASHFELIRADDYLKYAGLVGGIASVLGLVAIFRPPLTTDDINNIDAQSLKLLVEKTEKLNELEKKKSQTHHEINHLELQKNEMELFIKRASMSLFYKEQYSLYEKRLWEHVKSNKELLECIEKIEDFENKLKTLETEIDGDPNVDKLRELIDEINKKRKDPMFMSLLKEEPIVALLYKIIKVLKRYF